MNRISEEKRRAYRSELREAQADATRSRILDAAVRVMATGLASVSVPAVARDAGVSVPTVYRHFHTKQDLLAAVYPHTARRIGLDRMPDPLSVDDLKPLVRAVVERLDQLDDLSRAAMASPGAAEVRHATMASRYARLRAVADSVEPKLSAADRDRITRLVVVVTASASLRMWRDHLGLTADEVADEVEWIVEAAIAASSNRRQRP